MTNTGNKKTETEKNDEKGTAKKDFLLNKDNIDTSLVKSFLHFEDFQFYLAKIILSEIWIFRLTNLTEKSKTKIIAQNLFDEKQKEKVTNFEMVGSDKDGTKSGSEKSKEDEKKNQSENDKKVKNVSTDGRKKSLNDKKKENKDKDNNSEKEHENDHNNESEKESDGSRSPQKRTAVRRKIDEEVNFLVIETIFSAV